MGSQKRKRNQKKKDESDGETSKKRKIRCKERGRTVLDLVTKALKEHDPIKLEWDKVHRLPTGTYAGKFSSWVGVTARRHVSCIVETWDDVDVVTKKEILVSIKDAFNVIEDRYDWCLRKAGSLWRKWKCTLVREWLYDETGAIQRTPPELYDHITPDEWNVFVASHTTESFKEISAKNKKNASMKKTRFYGSRAGYRGIEIKVKHDFAAKGHKLEIVDRHLTWLKGHTPTNGEMTDYDKEVALKIEEIEKEVKAGTFKPEGREDILAKAIGKPEHGGRVRGVPDGICITEYFGKAAKKPMTEVECLKETINTLQSQVSNMQMMMVHFFQSGEKPSQEVLECFMKGMSMSTQGSKACASTDGDQIISIQEREEQSHQEPNRKESEEQSREEIPHKEPPREEIPHKEPPSKQGWRECKLSLPRNPNKMVASGFMYIESKEEFITVHGTSLLDGYKKVEVKKVHSGSENVKLPMPVRDELIVLIDAKDSYVQWPQNHIHSPSKLEIVTKEKKKKNQRFPPPLVPTILGVEVSSEFKQKLRTPLLNSLLLEARILKTSGALINVPIDDHVLHLDQYTSLISYEELIHLCDEGEIGASHIAIFMRYLSDLSDIMKSTSLYGFLFPETLSKFAPVSEDYRSDYIARAMTCTECGRGRKLIFAAYHESDHWMLAAISPSESIVYWCDPSGYTEPRQFFVETVTRAFEKRNSIDPLAMFEAKPLTWKIIKCPRQPVGSVLCGYYVCRYMLELVKGRYINITPSFMLNAPTTYTVEQIDEVRNIWAEFTLRFKPGSHGR